MGSGGGARSYSGTARDALLALAPSIAILLAGPGLVHVRVLLPVAAALCAFQLAMTWQRSTQTDRWRLLVFVGGSVGFVCAANLEVAAAAYPYVASLALTLLLAGAAFPIRVLRDPPDTTSRGEPPRSMGHALVVTPVVTRVVTLVVGASALWATFRLTEHRTFLDEVLYAMQAQYIPCAPFMRPLDPALAPFFALRQSYVIDGYLNGQYPPGWPLAVSLAPGPRSLAILLFAAYAAAVAATYAFGRAVASTRVGTFAALLVAINGFVLTYSVTVFPHTLMVALVLTAAVLMLAGAHAHGHGRAASTTLRWIIAGALLGFACAIRPLSGAALAVTVWLWVVVRERLGGRTATRLGAAMMVGAAAPLAWLLYVNKVTTGNPLRFGYDLAEHGLHALGFGLRGFVVYGPTGAPADRATMFDLWRAIGQSGRTMALVIADFWPAYVGLPILLVAAHAGFKWRWATVAAFGVLPAAYFFYFFPADRFYFELLPFAMVATACALDHVSATRRRAAVILGLMLVTTAIADDIARLAVLRADGRERNAYAHAVDVAAERQPRLLVFANDQLAAPDEEPIFEALYRFNVYNFPADIVVARDLGARDCDLWERFPDHTPVRIARGADGAPPVISAVTCAVRPSRP